MYRYKATLSYDGYDFYGFQAQGDKRTIEKELNEAFKLWLAKDIKIVGSGRTDKEVSALGQVIHFDLENKIDPQGIKRALNSFLPLDIRISEVEEVSLDFHARFSALKKEYRYQINIGDYSPFNYRYMPNITNLDIKKMIEASKLFIGTHNFKGFCSGDVDPRKDFVRTIYDIRVEQTANVVSFTFVGTGFLKYQVRRMMGILIEIGKNKEKKETITKVLETMDNRISHKVAPGNGLTLVKVYYN